MNLRWLFDRFFPIDRMKIVGGIFCAMIHGHFLLLVYLTTGFIAVVPIPASAGYGLMVPTLQPYRVLSPDGKWRLDVKPSNREGSGPATTTLSEANTGKIAWKQMLPYTFWQCCVNKNGIVGGYAYTGGVMGGKVGAENVDQFIISFLDTNGFPIHEEKSQRKEQGFSFVYGPSIYAQSLLLDAENDRMILRMPDGLIRCHSMCDGSLETAFYPEQKGNTFGYDTPDEIRFIPNTRLMLLQSNSARGNGIETTSTSYVQLIDSGGRTIWEASQRKIYGPEKKWPYPKYLILDPGPSVDDHSNVDPFAVNEAKVVVDPFAEVDPFTNTNETLELDGPPAPIKVATFEVYFGNTEEKAVFQIVDAGLPDRPSDYHVQEISRQKWKLPKEHYDKRDPVPPVDFPQAKSRKISSTLLKRADGSALGSIAAIALGPEQKIHALDKEKGLIHVFDHDGKFLHVCDFVKEQTIETNAHSASLSVDDKGEVFVKIAEQYSVAQEEKNPLSGHFLRFSPEGKLIPGTIAPPSAELGDKLIVQPKRNNLIFVGFGNRVCVTQRDQNGWHVATLSRRADGQWLDFISDVTCAPDGTIAVRDSSCGNESGGFITPFPVMPQYLPADNISLYRADGTHIRTLDFTRYAALTKIAFDGKRIVATSSYEPPTPIIYVFTAEGTAVGSIQIAELAGKKSVNLRAFIVSEGKEILAIDYESGMVFRYAMPDS